MADYYNVTTNLGDAEIAAAIASGTKLNITHIAFGDGNGSVPTPQKTRTALVREVHRQAINKYERHPTVQNWIVIEAIIPSNIGGFWVREIGVIANGKLISHGSHAPFEKVADSTDISEYRLRFTLNIKDGNVVNIILDQSLIYASQAWVEQFFLKRSDPEFLGNSATATRLLTARAVNFTGAATGVFSSNGAANSTCLLTLANSGVAASTYGNNVTVPVITVNAKGIISSVSNQAIRAASITQTGIVQLVDDLTTDDGVKAATARQVKLLNDNKLEKTANAASASKLATPRNIAISGAMQGNANFDGSGNVIIEVANPANLQVVTGSNYTITYDYSTRLAHIEMRVFSNQRIYLGLPRINDQSGHFKDITLPITLKKRLHTQAFFTTIDAVNVGQMGEAYEWYIWTPPPGIDGTTDSKVRISAARWMGTTDEFCNCDLSVTGYF